MRVGSSKPIWSEMESPGKNLSKFLEERDPANPKFWRRSWSDRRRADSPAATAPGYESGNEKAGQDFALWHDVFVEQKLPWGRFLQSVFLHTAAVAVLWTMSIAWIRQQKILDHAAFDRSALITYTPEEYLPPRSNRSFRFRRKRTTARRPSLCRPISNLIATCPCRISSRLAPCRRPFR